MALCEHFGRGPREPQIVECGCGYYSTPILAACARMRGGELLVFETNKDWADRVTAVVDVRIRIVSDWGELREHVRPGAEWFIDNGPKTRDRAFPARVMLDLSPQLVVLHDAVPEWDVVTMISEKMGGVRWHRKPDPFTAVWEPECREHFPLIGEGQE